jgi:alcohol dehydrogenase YqhD (iron-dependent ADH family)
MKNFFRSMGLPVTLAEANIGADRLGEMARKAVHFGPQGVYRKLEAADVEAILTLALR